MAKIELQKDRIAIDGTGIMIDTSGEKQLFDSGLMFDSGLYFDKWGDNPQQGEHPGISK
jgi:hypothetical protein